MKLRAGENTAQMWNSEIKNTDVSESRPKEMAAIGDGTSPALCHALRLLLAMAGAVVTILASSSLLAGFAGLTLPIAQWAQLPPMPLAISSALLLAGLSTLAVRFRWENIARVSGFCLLIGAVITAIATTKVAGAESRLIPLPAFLSQNLSPNALLCLFLISGGVFLMGASGLRHRAITLAMTGSALMALAAAVLLGSAMGLDPHDTWPGAVDLSMQSAVGIFLLSIAFVGFAWDESRSEDRPVPQWFPIPVGVGLITATLCLWQALLQQTAWPIPQLCLAGGLLGSLLLAFTTHLSIVSHDRARLCEQANSDLKREIQERQRIESELRASQALSQRIIECNDDCIQLMDPDGHLTFMNGRGQQLMEVDDLSALLGKPYVSILHSPEMREVASRAIERTRRGKITTFQARYPTAAGNPRWWQTIMAPIFKEPGQVEQLLVISRDITEHKQAAEALRESEERFRKVFDNGPVGMILINGDLEITRVNNAFCRILGYNRTDPVTRSLLAMLLPEDREKVSAQIRAMLSSEPCNSQAEVRYLTKSGEPLWVYHTASAVNDHAGEPLYGVIMIESIQERKQTEDTLLHYQEQLQSLTSELSLSEERERRRIATSLHDRIGQTLAFARLKLGALAQQLHGDSTHLTHELRDLIEQAITDTRSLTVELSPPVLYEIGLVAALEWLARKIEQEHQITTHFEDDGQAKPLDDKFRVVLFQAVRELLVNIVKHAHATAVHLTVRRDGDAIRIVIEDNGVGFDPAALQKRASLISGFGLFNVRERLGYLGGQLKIRSSPGEGTRITLLAPLKLEVVPSSELSHD